MVSWEQAVSRLLDTVGLDSIRGKILAFAVLATLVPSLTMARLSYVHNKQALTEKTNAELQNVSSHSARDTDLWLKERFYEIRVFSNSYEVWGNLERIIREGNASRQDLEAIRRLEEYLTSVRERSTDFDDLLVIDPQMRIVAASTDQPDTLHLPADWLNQVREEGQVLGEPWWDDATEQPLISFAVPVITENRFLGAMAGKASFLTIDSLIRTFSFGETGHLYLVAEDGPIAASSVLPTTRLLRTRMPRMTVQSLMGLESGSMQYLNYSGENVVGKGGVVPQVNWILVAEIGIEEAYAPIASMRNQTVVMVLGMMLGLGLIAYLLGLTIVRPLDRLTDGAGNVADGDLDVDLPIVSGGEMGYLTRIFNEMVDRLRLGREELERRSVTDDLTGLYNREHLMQRLTDEIARSARYEQKFTAMMIDLDHFKNYNDTHGHPAGDELLRRMTFTFQRVLRDPDYCARYGGEEFLIMLPQTSMAGAALVAERIRAAAEDAFGGSEEKAPVTVSVGVAEYPKHGRDVKELIEAADRALYGAKRKGRNRVVQSTTRRAATASTSKKTAKKTTKATTKKTAAKKATKKKTSKKTT
ncbi:diguanylate cyclase [Gemmatimonadota bacterium]